MRETRYRAWDKQERRYYEVTNINFPSTSAERELGIVVLSHDKTIYGENLVLEQYIGLEDEDDKLIFEGDIVRISDLDSGAVLTKDIVVWGNNFNPEFDLKNAPDDEPNSLSEYVSNENLVVEVIGNVHENPELLEGEK